MQNSNNHILSQATPPSILARKVDVTDLQRNNEKDIIDLETKTKVKTDTGYQGIARVAHNLESGMSNAQLDQENIDQPLIIANNEIIKQNDNATLATNDNFDQGDIGVDQPMVDIRPKNDKQVATFQTNETNSKQYRIDERNSADHKCGVIIQPQNISPIKINSTPTQISEKNQQPEVSEKEVTGKLFKKNSEETCHSLSQEKHNDPAVDTTDSILSDTDFRSSQGISSDNEFIDECDCADTKSIPVLPNGDIGHLTEGKSNSNQTQTNEIKLHFDTSEMIDLGRRNRNDKQDNIIKTDENKPKQNDDAVKKNSNNHAVSTKDLNMSDTMLDTEDKINRTHIVVDQPVNDRCCNKSVNKNKQEIERNLTRAKNNQETVGENKAEYHVNETHDLQRENRNKTFLKYESNENEAKQYGNPESIDSHAGDTNGLKVQNSTLDTFVKIDPTNIAVDQSVNDRCCNLSTSETERDIERNVTEQETNHGPTDESKTEEQENEHDHLKANVNKCSSEDQQFNYDQQRENQNNVYLKCESNDNEPKQNDCPAMENIHIRAVVTSATEQEFERNVTEDETNHELIDDSKAEDNVNEQSKAEDNVNEHGHQKANVDNSTEVGNMFYISKIKEKYQQSEPSEMETVNHNEPINQCRSEDKQFNYDPPREKYNFKQYIYINAMSGTFIDGGNIYTYHYCYCQYVLTRGERKGDFTKMSRFSLVMTESSFYCLKSSAWLFEDVHNTKPIYFCAEMSSILIYAVPYFPTSYLDLALYFNRPVERENRNSATGELLDPFRIGNTVSTLQGHAVSNRDDGAMSRSLVTAEISYRLFLYFQRQRSIREPLAMYQHNMHTLTAQRRYRPLNHTQTEPPGMRLPQLSEAVSYEERPRTRVVAVRPEVSGRSHNTDNEIQTGTRTSQHSDTRVTFVDPEATGRRHNTENELPTGALMPQGSDTLISAEQFGTHITVLPPSESRPITETANQTFCTPETQGSDTLTLVERSGTRVKVVPPSGNRPLTETENHTESSACGSSGHRGTEPIMFCRYCYANVIAVMFLPCQHAVCCKDCSKRFTVCDECTMPIKKKRSLN